MSQNLIFIKLYSLDTIEIVLLTCSLIFPYYQGVGFDVASVSVSFVGLVCAIPYRAYSTKGFMRKFILPSCSCSFWNCIWIYFNCLGLYLGSSSLGLGGLPHFVCELVAPLSVEYVPVDVVDALLLAD